jgi:hypothetical protein
MPSSFLLNSRFIFAQLSRKDNFLAYITLKAFIFHKYELDKLVGANFMDSFQTIITIKFPNIMASKYSKGAQDKVGEALHEEKEGTLKSGRSGKTVTSRKQAIAIGLSEARAEGKKVPEKKTAAKKSDSKKSATPKKAAAKKSAPKKEAAKKSTTKKAAAPKKTAAKKSTTKKTATKKSTTPKKSAAKKSAD